MKTITFTVRMPIPDDADPADQAAELLRYGVSGVEQGVEALPETMREGSVPPNEPTAYEHNIAAKAIWEYLGYDGDDWDKPELLDTKFQIEDVASIAIRAYNAARNANEQPHARTAASLAKVEPEGERIMPKFRAKAIVVEAEQFFFNGPDPWPEGVTTDAKINPCIDTPDGTVWINDGDWIVTGMGGEKYPLTDADFRRIYEPIEVAYPTDAKDES